MKRIDVGHMDRSNLSQRFVIIIRVGTRAFVRDGLSRRWTRIVFDWYLVGLRLVIVRVDRLCQLFGGRGRKTCKAWKQG